MASLQDIVDRFNRDFPVGTKVILVRDSGNVVTTVRAAAELLQGHSPVAWFQGVSGAYSIRNNRVMLAAPEPPRSPIPQTDEQRLELAVSLLERVAPKFRHYATLTGAKAALCVLEAIVSELMPDDYPAPDREWGRDFFLLTGEHMVLTEEGWIGVEPGVDPGEVLDEVNAPS